MLGVEMGGDARSPDPKKDTATEVNDILEKEIPVALVALEDEFRRMLGIAEPALVNKEA